MRYILGTFIILAALASCKQNKASDSNAFDPTNKVTVHMYVSGMTCAGCEQAIVSSVTSIDGTMEAKADHEAGTALIVFDKSKTTIDALSEAISKKGYTVDNFEIADAKVE
ncbi:cation transporter [Bacteroidota bacterium]